MKNKPADLHNLLFERLEILCDGDLTGGALLEEIARSRAVSDIAGRIVSNQRLTLDAARLLAADGRGADEVIPELLAPARKANGATH